MSYIPLISPDKYRFCQEEIKHISCRFFFFLKFFLFLKQIQAITTALHNKRQNEENRYHLSRFSPYFCPRYQTHHTSPHREDSEKTQPNPACTTKAVPPKSSHKKSPLLLQGIIQSIAQQKPPRRTALIVYLG